MPEETQQAQQPQETQQPSTIEAHLSDAMGKALTKIDGADSILVALSKDPSVDEMAAAIALTLFLDGIGKHATAIYSGATPNALQFLKPEDTFESDTNSLQDFIIALNKEKADHLRYKIEGDFVKVYITPYKTTLGEGDLEFSHGDYNVDLVIGIDVKNTEDLDAALSEYGRIMHDATSINITNNTPGNFAEVEWSDTQASAVCEMIYRLIMGMGDKAASMQSDVATALLTGVVASTERFSNEKTTPDVMELSAKLMEAGADQQLISSNIVKSGETEPTPTETEVPQSDTIGVLSVEREEESVPESTADDAEKQLEEMITPPAPVTPAVAELQEAVAQLSNTEPAPAPVLTPAETTPEVVPEVPQVTAVPEVPSAPEVPAAPVEIPAAAIEPTPVAPITPANSVAPAEVHTTANPVASQATINVPDMIDLSPKEEEFPKDYGKMIEEELAKPLPVELEQAAAAQAAAQPVTITSPIEENPAAAAAPAVEVPKPDESILPPPPPPPIELENPGAAAPSQPPVLEVQQPQPSATPAPTTDPGAFQIPAQ